MVLPQVDALDENVIIIRVTTSPAVIRQFAVFTPSNGIIYSLSPYR